MPDPISRRLVLIAAGALAVRLLGGCRTGEADPVTSLTPEDVEATSDETPEEPSRPAGRRPRR